MARAKRPARVAATVAPPRVGAISNLFRGNPEAVATLFHRYGLESVQIQPTLGRQESMEFTPSICRAMSQPFMDADIMIAGVSAYTNFVDPDISRRRRLIKKFDSLIEHCQDFGTQYLITESGTLDPEHPWNDFAENRTPGRSHGIQKESRSFGETCPKRRGSRSDQRLPLSRVHSMDIALAIHEHFGDSVGFVMDPANYFTRNMITASTSFLRNIFKSWGASPPWLMERTCVTSEAC